MKKIESLLVKMIETQEEILTKMNRIETRFEKIATKLEKVTDRQIKLENEFEIFKENIVEQVSRELMRSKRFYH